MPRAAGNHMCTIERVDACQPPFLYDSSCPHLVDNQIRRGVDVALLVYLYHFLEINVRAESTCLSKAL